MSGTLHDRVLPSGWIRAREWRAPLALRMPMVSWVRLDRLRVVVTNGRARSGVRA